jgi:hypothetical protein
MRHGSACFSHIMMHPCKYTLVRLSLIQISMVIFQRFSNCAPPPGRALLVLLGRGRVFCMRYTLFWTKYGRNIKKEHIFRHFAWMTYHLIPVLAPNYKQRVLSLDELRKVCYLLPELCHIRLYEFIRVEGGVKSMRLLKADASYDRLGTFCNIPSLQRENFRHRNHSPNAYLHSPH